MVNMSTAEKVRAKIRFHQGEVERLEEFLKQLEEFESEDSAERVPLPRRRRRRRPEGTTRTVTRSNRFKGLSVVPAAITLITESSKHALDTHEIAGGLEAGGFETKSKDFYNTVHALLHRESKKDKPGVRRDGKLWRLTSAV
jgi:hypothetical protein